MALSSQIVKLTCIAEISFVLLAIISISFSSLFLQSKNSIVHAVVKRRPTIFVFVYILLTKISPVDTEHISSI